MPALTLEAGKFYRSRDGHKIGPMAFRTEFNDYGADFAFKPVNSLSPADCYRSDGSWHLTDTEDPHDLVAEWSEPSADFDTSTFHPGKSYLQRLADAAEKIATVLEAIEKHLAPVVTAERRTTGGHPWPVEVDLTLPAVPNDDWIEWHGDECPFPNGTKVDTRDRDGTTDYANKLDSTPGTSGRMYWNHDAHGTGPRNDVIAYRLAR